MKTNEIINLGMMSCCIAAGCGFAFLVGWVIKSVREEHQENKEREIRAKHQRIVDADDLLNEYEIGLEWGKD